MWWDLIYCPLTCSALLLHVLALRTAKMALELCHILLVSLHNSILLQLGLQFWPGLLFDNITC